MKKVIYVALIALAIVLGYHYYPILFETITASIKPELVCPAGYTKACSGGVCDCYVSDPNKCPAGTTFTCGACEGCSCFCLDNN